MFHLLPFRFAAPIARFHDEVRGSPCRNLRDGLLRGPATGERPFFEYEAYEASYNSLNYSWYAWQTDGFGVEGSYSYWATVYSYYGYAYALYGHQYDIDSMFDTARDYHLGARDLWQDLINWNAAGETTYVARDKAQTAADWCWWAWVF